MVQHWPNTSDMPRLVVPLKVSITPRFTGENSDKISITVKPVVQHVTSINPVASHFDPAIIPVNSNKTRHKTVTTPPDNSMGSPPAVFLKTTRCLLGNLTPLVQILLIFPCPKSYQSASTKRQNGAILGGYKPFLFCLIQSMAISGS